MSKRLSALAWDPRFILLAALAYFAILMWVQPSSTGLGMRLFISITVAVVGTIMYVALLKMTYDTNNIQRILTPPLDEKEAAANLIRSYFCSKFDSQPEYLSLNWEGSYWFGIFTFLGNPGKIIVREGEVFPQATLT